MEFSPIFLKCFRYPPDATMEDSKAYYLPLKENDFINFLQRISEYSKTAIDTLNDDKITQLYHSITVEDCEYFKGLFEYINNMESTTLNQIEYHIQRGNRTKGELPTEFFMNNGSVKIHNLGLSNEFQIKQLEKYAEFWNEYNYLYPCCVKCNLTVEQSPFARGGYSRCYEVLNHVPDRNSRCTVKFPQKMVFKELIEKSTISLEKYCILSYAYNMKELWFSIYAGLNECKHIHLLSGLFTYHDTQGYNSTPTYGYLSEKAQHGSLYHYLKNKKGESFFNILLRELFFIAEAINFMHEKNIVHEDIKLYNILVFSDESNNFTLKLSDFGLSKKLNCCRGFEKPRNWNATLGREIIKNIIIYRITFIFFPVCFRNGKA